MKIEIGSFEAKTRLPELLRGVRMGKRYTITLRGQPVADLLPPERLLAVSPSRAVDDMLAFMQSRKSGPGGSGVDIKALIDEGRE